LAGGRLCSCYLPPTIFRLVFKTFSNSGGVKGAGSKRTFKPLLAHRLTHCSVGSHAEVTTIGKEAFLSESRWQISSPYKPGILSPVIRMSGAERNKFSHASGPLEKRSKSESGNRSRMSASNICNRKGSSFTTTIFGDCMFIVRSTLMLAKN
jgi:hypothetical protein